jgi:glycosyltransferase involved in cell wall biosynthesis
MRIAKIVPGSGGTFYCQNCMHDVAFTRALRALGHDVVLVPLYLPVTADDPEIAGNAPVFFGGVNMYLRERFPLFRRLPRVAERLLDARWILRLAARRDGTTRARGMGRMTLSTIRGELGGHAREVDRLARWLADSVRPDVVHLSNVLLIGLAARLREVLRVPVVCTLMDEDVWLDHLDPPYDARCWDAIAERADGIAAFIAASHTYAARIRDRLRLDPARIRVVHPGLDLADYRDSPLPFDPPVVGYLSKMSASLGLGDLVEAFIRVKSQTGLEHLRLRAMGGMPGPDADYVAGLRRRLAALGMERDADFLPALDRVTRLRFLETLTVLSVPVPGGEAFGTFMIEAWAAGVPVVQPEAGAFPELVRLTGGGELYAPQSPDALAAALAALLLNPARVRALGAAGRAAVHSRFGIESAAAQTAEVYASVAGGPSHA